MRKISRRVQKEEKLQSIIEGNMKINEPETSNVQLDKADTSQLFFGNNKEDIMDDTIQLTQQKEQATTKKQRKDLHLLVFLAIIGMEFTFTFYPAVMFTRTNGTYEFMSMQFCFSIAFLLAGIYMLRDAKQLLLLYFMLDPLMIVTLCLISTYIMPYIAMDRVNAVQILEEIGYFICNISIVGFFRIILLHMNWTPWRVIVYKLSKTVSILFYLFFGTYYVLKDISYSKRTDDDLDGKVQDLVILFVFSGFALQLEIFNRVSDFDKTSELKSDYMIVSQSEDEQEKKSVQNKSDKKEIAKKQPQKESSSPKIKLSPITPSNNPIKVLNKPVQFENHSTLTVS